MRLQRLDLLADRMRGRACPHHQRHIRAIDVGVHQPHRGHPVGPVGLDVQEAGLPEGIFQILHLTHAEVERVIGDERIDFVAFTGSVEGGHAVQRAAASRAQATEAAFAKLESTGDLGRFRYIHIASHAFLSPRGSSLSGVVLAKDPAAPTIVVLS